MRMHAPIRSPVGGLRRHLRSGWEVAEVALAA